MQAGNDRNCRGGGMNSSGRRPFDLSMFLINLAMQWAEHSFLQEIRAANGRAKPNAAGSSGRPKFTPQRPLHVSCRLCRNEMSATRATPLAGDVPFNSPNDCPYLRALFRDLARLLAQDPKRLAEWHQLAVEQYCDGDL
jgi:hypothetical protein